MPDAVTDTHGLVWYLEDDPRLGSAARAAFEACDRGEIAIYVPTICLVEIVYLQEKGRIAPTLKSLFDAVLQSGATRLVPTNLTVEIVDSLNRVSRTDIPDMPDRIIVATALHLGLRLISRDSKIQVTSVQTIW
ncbi:MAG: type II toxin-antitoxin system VapC family toxin [Chloroflexota bacterium]|nr:type II toxin-antitoxin system VapC family toxin [Chloroflexota bacterium]MDQ5867445.1 type II toxin-antitoxin system VapC family toxin [Chloroflexota bacterium]